MGASLASWSCALDHQDHDHDHDQHMKERDRNNTAGSDDHDHAQGIPSATAQEEVISPMVTPMSSTTTPPPAPPSAPVPVPIPDDPCAAPSDPTACDAALEVLYLLTAQRTGDSLLPVAALLLEQLPGLRHILRTRSRPQALDLGLTLRITVLGLAAVMGHPQLMALYLEEGHHQGHQEEEQYGMTLLHLTVLGPQPQPACVALALRCCDPADRDVHGQTALHYALQRRCCGAVTVLLQSSASSSASTSASALSLLLRPRDLLHGNTSLHTAALHPDEACLRALMHCIVTSSSTPPRRWLGFLGERNGAGLRAKDILLQAEAEAEGDQRVIVRNCLDILSEAEAALGLALGTVGMGKGMAGSSSWTSFGDHTPYPSEEVPPAPPTPAQEDSSSDEEVNAALPWSPQNELRLSSKKMQGTGWKRNFDVCPLSFHVD